MTPELEQAIADNVSAALEEDLGGGDLTAALIDPDAVVGATIVARESIVVAGQPWVDEVFSRLDSEIVVDWYIGDGGTADADDVVCKLVGNARHLLSGERTALNFLQTLSATATTAAAWVDAVRGTRATILDTRKTIPGLRQAQKYAVRIGGASNHRTGLFDAILIKENHIRAAGSIPAALQAANASVASTDDDTLVEIEVESLDELRKALDSGATRILLDNFSLDDLKAAVDINAGYGYVAAELEASGNISLDNVREIAETGVDYISTGALTKNVKAADLSMLLSI
ncbi:MAG: carboxylating nicotinate-nucleotide diphosphorylase [Woeseiaceae bacterium]|nr:carboxylating nicotinate-nucleotide diphosphorylase [Woeseiaceae bacterium]